MIGISVLRSFNDDEKNLHRDLERLDFILFVYTGLCDQ